LFTITLTTYFLFASTYQLEDTEDVQLGFYIENEKAYLYQMIDDERFYFYEEDDMYIPITPDLEEEALGLSINGIPNIESKIYSFNDLELDGELKQLNFNYNGTSYSIDDNTKSIILYGTAPIIAPTIAKIKSPKIEKKKKLNNQNIKVTQKVKSIKKKSSKPSKKIRLTMPTDTTNCYKKRKYFKNILSFNDITTDMNFDDFQQLVTQKLKVLDVSAVDKLNSQVLFDTKGNRAKLLENDYECLQEESEKKRMEASIRHMDNIIELSKDKTLVDLKENNIRKLLIDVNKYDYQIFAINKKIEQYYRQIENKKASYKARINLFKNNLETKAIYKVYIFEANFKTSSRSVDIPKLINQGKENLLKKLIKDGEKHITHKNSKLYKKNLEKQTTQTEIYESGMISFEGISNNILSYNSSSSKNQLETKRMGMFLVKFIPSQTFPNKKSKKSKQKNKQNKDVDVYQITINNHEKDLKKILKKIGYKKDYNNGIDNKISENVKNLVMFADRKQKAIENNIDKEIDRIYNMKVADTEFIMNMKNNIKSEELIKNNLKNEMQNIEKQLLNKLKKMKDYFKVILKDKKTKTDEYDRFAISFYSLIEGVGQKDEDNGDIVQRTIIDVIEEKIKPSSKVLSKSINSIFNDGKITSKTSNSLNNDFLQFGSVDIRLFRSQGDGDYDRVFVLSKISAKLKNISIADKYTIYRTQCEGINEIYSRFNKNISSICNKF